MRVDLSLPRHDSGEFPTVVDTDHSFGALTQLLHEVHGERQKFVIVDANVAALSPLLMQSLNRPRVTVIQVPAGETHKTWDTTGTLLHQIISHGPSRDDLIVGIGGGTILNTAGVVAGVLLRGMPLIHIPTTLTAQADVCLGGKQAVNFLGYKNQVGLYYDPVHCYINTAFHHTVVASELRLQLVEGLKLCMAASASEFWDIYGRLATFDGRDDVAMAELVIRLLRLKAPFVRTDPFELREGLCLMYGHTVGHAIEMASQGAVSHCEAVAIGMAVAARIAHALGLCDWSHVDLHCDLARLVGVAPVIPLQLSPSVINEHLQHDKKKYRGTIRFVLTNAVGVMVQQDGQYFSIVPFDAVSRALSESYGG
ncbi:MAG: hypothetical protein M3O61_15050 [Gemmatimonadota bacterium]|nr:hypothetical protein [Gemmatimonadota bacterium]